MPSRALQALVDQLVGLPCTQAKSPHGSILSLDFGPLGRRGDDDASDEPHGWRHLTVLSPWRVQDSARVRFDWNHANAEIQRAVATLLLGCNVVDATMMLPGCDLIIRLSNGLELRVFGDSTADRVDAWFILGTDGAEAGASPQTQ